MPDLSSLAPFSRDDPRYWERQPALHNEAGFFVFGPQEAKPITARLAESNHCSDPTPLVSERTKVRLQRFARGISGARPTTRNRSRWRVAA